MRDIYQKLLIGFVVILGLSYFLSVYLHNYLKDIVISQAKQIKPRIIQIQVKRKELQTDFLEAFSLISFEKIEEQVIVKQNSQGDGKNSPPSYRVTFIFLGEKKFAIVNGILFREGDRISPEEKIIKIKEDGIILYGKWGERWIPLSK